MIAYSVIVLSLWIGSIFIPFFFVGFENSDQNKLPRDSHFLRG